MQLDLLIQCFLTDISTSCFVDINELILNLYKKAKDPEYQYNTEEANGCRGFALSKFKISYKFVLRQKDRMILAKITDKQVNETKYNAQKEAHANSVN